MDEILNRLKNFEKDKIIKFLCNQLGENIEMCPGALYDYDGNSPLCGDCPGDSVDTETMALCWLKVAEHDTSQEGVG